jgi:SAM-dependent methyltransferase
VTNSIELMEDLDRCPICGSTDVKHYASRPDEGLIYSLQYERCRNCEVVYLSRRVKEGHVAILYPDDYAPYTPIVSAPPQRTGIRKLLSTLRRRVLLRARYGLYRNLEQFYWMERRGRLLDFGCGSSAFLDTARDRGWATVGSDFSPNVVERVADAGHEAYLVDDLWANVPDGSIDAIRMNHVLEHLYEPKATLERLIAKLTTEGRIHIAVPNPRGVSARIFSDAWIRLEARHVILYPPEFVTRLLEEAGVSRVQVVHEPTTKDLLGSLDHRLRRQRDANRARRPSRLMNTYAINQALRPLAILVAKFGYGDRFHVFGKR